MGGGWRARYDAPSRLSSAALRCAFEGLCTVFVHAGLLLHWGDAGSSYGSQCCDSEVAQYSGNDRMSDADFWPGAAKYRGRVLSLAGLRPVCRVVWAVNWMVRSCPRG